jgi:hypothetical protein
LALIYLDRTLHSARLRSAIAFGGFLLWQMLCSVYLAFMSLVALTTYGLVVLLEGRPSLRFRGVALALGAAVVAGALFAAVHTPHLALRSMGEITDWGAGGLVVPFSSGAWSNWVLPPIALREWGYRLATGLPSYLGLLPVAGAACVLVWPRCESTRWAAPACLAMALVGYALALGPHTAVFGQQVTLPYGYLLEWVPGFSSMRVPSRFAALAMTGLSALAGIGLGRAMKSIDRRPGGRWLATGVVVFAIVGTAIEYDLPFDPPQARAAAAGDRIPPVYSELAARPAGPVLEIPFGLGDSFGGGLTASTYMYYSTFHWNPLLNGYTGYEPRSAHPVETLARALPDARALDLLVRSTGMRYVVVHPTRLPQFLRRRWSAAPAGLSLIGRYGNDLLFEVVDPPEPDLLERMRDGPPAGQTLLGLHIEPVPSVEQLADLRFSVPPPELVEGGSDVPIEVHVANRSDTAWPALALDSSGLLALDYRWAREGRAPSRHPAWNLPPTGRLPYDLSPGESVRVRLLLQVPKPPGLYALVIRLRQDGEWFEGTLMRRVRVERRERARTRGTARPLSEKQDPGPRP